MTTTNAGPPASLLDEPAARAVRVVALRLLDEAAAAQVALTSSAHARADPEALHDFRVAVRRLRSWLRAYRDVLRGSVPRKAARRVRALADATGASRDAEVHLAWLRGQRRGLSARQRVGLDWLVARTRERKRAGDDALAAALGEHYARAHRTLARTLGAYTITVRVDAADRAPPPAPTFAATAAALVDAHAAELRAALAAVRTRADEVPAHAARIAAKRLRYLLEPAAPYVDGGQRVVDELKALQDALGDVHDVFVFCAEIAALTAESAPTAHAPPTEHDPRPGLAAIVRRLRARADAAWTAVERDWLGEERGAERGAPFFERVAAVVRALERRCAPGSPDADTRGRVRP